MNYLLILSLVGGMLLASCQPIALSEKQMPIPHEAWESSLVPAFEFEVQDTNSYYNVFLYLRHRNTYAYNNIWLRVYATTPPDTMDVKKEFVLANSRQWLGKSITGDIVEHFIPISPLPIKFHQPRLSIQLEQMMQEDPLHHILSVGIRLQRVDAVH